MCFLAVFWSSSCLLAFFGWCGAKNATKTPKGCPGSVTVLHLPPFFYKLSILFATLAVPLGGLLTRRVVLVSQRGFGFVSRLPTKRKASGLLVSPRGMVAIKGGPGRRSIDVSWTSFLFSRKKPSYLFSRKNQQPLFRKTQLPFPKKLATFSREGEVLMFLSLSVSNPSFPKNLATYLPKKPILLFS